MREQTRLYPGVLETLRRLHDSGLGLAICSNKAVQFTQDLVQNLGLSPYISEVLGPESVGAAKPDPAMLLEACRRLKVSREEAIYVGDMSIDVHAGQAAGIPVYLVNVGVAGRDDPRQLGPEKVLNDFTELQAFAESGPRATA
jgi:HAD superfamily hydrolase (TIGR01509 family)